MNHRTLKAVFFRPIVKVENVIALVSLAAILLVSLLEIFGRALFHTGFPSATPLVIHSTLVFACLGAAIASRDGRQLGISSDWNSRGAFGTVMGALRAFLVNTVLWILFFSSVSMVLMAFDPGASVAGIPLWCFVLAIPLAFGLMATQALYRDLRGHPIAAFLGGLFALFAAASCLVNIADIVFGASPPWLSSLAGWWASFAGVGIWPLVLILIASAFIGVPLFVVLAALAVLAFSATGGALETVTYASYAMLTGNIIPAIPLFTLTGILLAESGAGKRLVALVRALFGSIRGGPAIAAVVVSAFFTTFSGASGVTILALGGLLAFILRESGYNEFRTEGLLTASGAIGLLFPPSLAIIVYGSVAQVSILDLFIGGALPGTLMVVAMAIAGVWFDRSSVRTPFSGKEALSTLKGSIGELLLPVLVIAGYFSGYFTLVETGAFAAFYVIILEVVIYRDISWKGLPAVALKSVPITGGVLIILASARALSDFLVDQQVPMFLASWAQVHIPNQWVFILMLNLVLLLVGCLMDLFSAILIVAPLVIPVAALFGIHPVHLGIMFLTNLGLGFLTPPVGMDLFIASYTFGKPLGRIYRSIVPFLLIQLVVLLLVSYLPILTTLFLKG